MLTYMLYLRRSDLLQDLAKARYGPQVLERLEPYLLLVCDGPLRLRGNKLLVGDTSLTYSDGEWTLDDDISLVGWDLLDVKADARVQA